MSVRDALPIRTTVLRNYFFGFLSMRCALISVVCVVGAIYSVAVGQTEGLLLLPLGGVYVYFAHVNFERASGSSDS